MGIDLNVIGRSYNMLFKNGTLLKLGAIGAIVSAIISFFIMTPLLAVKGDPVALSTLSSSPMFWIGIGVGIVASVLISVFIMGAIIRATYMGDTADLNDSAKVSLSRYVPLFCTNIGCGAISLFAFLPALVFIILGAAITYVESYSGTAGSGGTVFLGVGFVLAIMPGLYVALRLSLSEVACVAGGKRTFESLDRSWTATSGNLWGILAVILALGIVDGIAGGIVSALNSTAGAFVSAFLAYPITIALVLIYMQIAADRTVTAKPLAPVKRAKAKPKG